MDIDVVLMPCEQQEPQATALILTKNKLLGLNLHTFEMISLLESTPSASQQSNEYFFTSLKLSSNHVFLAVSNWGIMVYKSF